MDPTTGIHGKNNKVVVTFLNLLLADEYVLYTKIRAAHWNIDEANNFEIQVFLENQYNALDVMIDEIAERIRFHGQFALGSLKNFLSIAQICDDNLNFRNSQKTFESLLTDHQEIISIIQHETFPIFHKFKDVDTANLLMRLMDQHKRQAWMLRSFLSGSNFKTTGNIQHNSAQLTSIQE